MNRLIIYLNCLGAHRCRALLALLALLMFLSVLLLPQSHGATGSKEIYGPDYRMDIVEVADPAQVAMSHAVGGLVLRNHLTRQPNGSYLVHTRELLVRADNHESYPLCPEEPFSDQPVLPFCTTFLVGPDILVTAGHCMDFPAEDLAVVFGYQVNQAGSAPALLPASNVYFIEKVLHNINTRDKDYAIMQLDRRVPEERDPLNFRRIGRVHRNIPVGVIGHPLGLPLKIAFGDQSVVYDDRDAQYFIANFDASAGNSGSPVINQRTGVVEGIYIYSTVEDLVFSEDGCWEQNRVTLDEAGQGVYRITHIAELLDQAIADSEEAWETELNKHIPACGLTSLGANQAEKFNTNHAILVGLLLILMCYAHTPQSTKNHHAP